MSSKDDKAIAGQAIYTPKILSVYDLVVIAISNRYIWKCPSTNILEHYDNHLSDNHLDVGVGTGYFLDHCRFPSEQPRVALMDMNANSLAFAARRIQRYKPESYQHNVLTPLNQELKPFDSVALNYLFHCLPGDIEEKATVLDYLSPVVQPGARIFGSTILHKGVERSWTARQLMALYNRKGVFSNRQDDLVSLEKALAQRCDDVEIRIQGCVALFSGRYK